MKSLKYFIILSCFITTISSCVAPYYTPVTQSVPMIDEKTELVVTGACTDLGSFSGHAAYGISDQIAANISMHSISGYIQGLEEADRTDYLYEGSIGYFKKLPNGFMFDVYGGYGLGKDYKFGRDVTWHRFSIQPTIGFKSNAFDIGFTPRINFVNFNIKNKKGYIDQYEHQRSYSVEDLEHNIYSFFEPAVTMRVGYKYGKIFLQYSAVQKLTNKSLYYGRDQLSLGITFNFRENFPSRNYLKQ